MKDLYFSYIQSQFPHISENAKDLLSDNLLSPFKLELPLTILQQAQKVVSHLYALRENKTYQQAVYAQVPAIAQKDPGNKSICMSYDFHVDSTGQLKLIEVNTNASFLLMGTLLYQSQNLPLPVTDFYLQEIQQNIIEESKLAQQPLNSIAIVDEAPSTQKLFFEFLLYEQFFKHLDYAVTIADPSELSLDKEYLICGESKIDFVYNRTTDFYLQASSMTYLSEAYQRGNLTLSPNPHEYALLADKQRLIDWGLTLQNSSLPGFAELSPIRNHLLETHYLNSENQESIWNQKKKFFFKPLTSFGSKGGYRGEGISRVHFDQLIGKPVLAQEYCPAPEQIFTPSSRESLKLKYDLRFYAYKDRVQMAIGRLYQGQVTNLKTLHGGFAPLIFT